MKDPVWFPESQTKPGPDHSFFHFSKGSREVKPQDDNKESVNGRRTFIHLVRAMKNPGIIHTNYQNPLDSNCRADLDVVSIMLIQSRVRLSHSLVLKVSCVAGRMIAPWSAQLPGKTCQPCTSASKSWYNASERVQKQDRLNGCIQDENTAPCWPSAFVFFSLVSSSGTFDYLFSSKLLWLKVLLSFIIFGVLNPW